MVTLKDIAQEADVSVMTVSRVVNRHYTKVSKDNIKKIEKIIARRGYVPNSTARSLSSKSSKIISVIIRGQGNQLKDAYNANMVGEITTNIQERGYYIMLHFIDKYDDITQRLRSWNAEGCIFLGTFDEDIKKIHQDNLIPLVFTDSYSKIRQIINIGIDDYKGGSLAAQHFVNMGHSEFAFIGKTLESSVVRTRLSGYKDTLESLGFSLYPKHIIEANEPADILAKKIFNFKEHTSAIFTTADIIAIELIDYMKSVGKTIPDDYSFIGFDDIPISHSICPPLTTITQSISKKAEIAVNSLFRHIQDSSLPAENIILDVNLFERKSVKHIST